MKFITNIFNRIIARDTIKPLGRWNIDYCSDKINRKIDLSNEDHCGPCGIDKPIITAYSIIEGSNEKIIVSKTFYLKPPKN